MTYLTEHLPFASSSNSNHALPPPRTHLLVTDTLTSPAHFVLYHLISAAVLDKRKVVWVDFRGERRTSLESALKKAGTILPPSNSKLFTAISPSSLPSPLHGNPPLFDGEKATLRPTYDAIKKELQGQSSIVILDGLAELTWMGFEPGRIHQFARAVLAQVRLTELSMVSILHADHLPLLSTSLPVDPTTPEADLLHRLMRISNGWWRVSGLSSGRSGNVSGEISSHNLVSLSPDNQTSIVNDVPRSRPLQYRLESNTVKLFAKGTERGYL